jgi:hypothetical protein
MNKHRFVSCTSNEGYEGSLELRKLYEVLPDLDAEKHEQLRIVDESGEDYLYPESYFIALNLPQQIVDRVVHAA